MQLKKLINNINNHYENVKKESFTELDWQKQGSKIRVEIYNFTKVKNDLTQKVNIIRENTSPEKEKEIIDHIKSLLEEARNITEFQINEINEKTKNFNNNDDIGNGPSQELNNDINKQEIVMDLMNNREFLEHRRKELEKIYKVSAMLKDTTDKMAVDLNQQRALLDEIETHIDISYENAKKAKQEIIKADEISRGNRNKSICLIF